MDRAAEFVPGTTVSPRGVWPRAVKSNDGTYIVTSMPLRRASPKRPRLPKRPGGGSPVGAVRLVAVRLVAVRLAVAVVVGDHAEEVRAEAKKVEVVVAVGHAVVERAAHAATRLTHC